MSTMKVSQEGLTQIKQAIALRGWKVYDDRWLLAASNILEPDGFWQPEGPYAYGCSSQTWERFLRRIAIRDRSFMAFCRALMLEPEAVSEPSNRCQTDWGNAPDAVSVYGRESVLKTLAGWIFEERCRIISLTGMAGVGKTCLMRGALDQAATPFACRVRAKFDCVIWRRLDALTPTAMLHELIATIAKLQAIPLAECALPDSSEGLISQLLQQLRQYRCLLVLDNAESVMAAGDRAGCYRDDYEAYTDCFRRLGETAHQSCIVLIGREQLRDIENCVGLQPVRSHRLEGIDPMAGQAICQKIAQAHSATIRGSDQDWTALTAIYRGHPLSLEIATQHILRRFGGDLSQFLAQDLRVFGRIRDMLDWHFQRLSKTGQEVVFWLAFYRQTLSIDDLESEISSPLAKKQLPETLDMLERQLPIEKRGTRLSLPPVLADYAIDRLNHQIYRALKAGKLQSFHTRVLSKVSVEDLATQPVASIYAGSTDDIPQSVRPCFSTLENVAL
ncbi:putative membrane protein [Leptolyngbya sp. PCC 7375]|nr:putative membrane protein [Leptolyngbya sp. PCC 7375]